MQGEMKQQLAALIACYRSQCLWFFAEDCIPETLAEAVRILEYIEPDGDCAALVRAWRLKQ
jgi:hypothetical protein